MLLTQTNEESESFVLSPERTWTSSAVTLTIAFQQKGVDFLLLKVWHEFEQILHLGDLQKKSGMKNFTARQQWRHHTELKYSP